MPGLPGGRVRGGSTPVVVALVLIVAAVSALALASPALAHDQLVTSSPVDGSRLTQAPATVRLRFAEPVDPRLTTVAVSGPHGELRVAEPHTSGAVVLQRLPREAPVGTYSVAYRVVSGDGHPVTGMIRFDVGVVGDAGGPAASSTAVPPRGLERHTAPVLVGGVVAIAALSVALMARSRRSGRIPA